MAEQYEGLDVVFSQGVHYPVVDDEPDLSRPLRWESGYRLAVEGEPLHNDVNHLSEIELPVGGE